MAQIPNIKYKTQYCHSWREGIACDKGGACFFAHGEQELRTIQQVQLFLEFGVHPFSFFNHDEIVKQNSYISSIDYKPTNYKTIFCKFYADGNCKLGNKCTYAHERRQKRKKKLSQQYNQPGKLEMPLVWQNYQLYQYYAQAYMSQFPLQEYYYEGQNKVNALESQNQEPQKVEGNYMVNQTINGSNNIKEQLTFNQPIPHAADNQLSNSCVSSNPQYKGQS